MVPAIALRPLVSLPHTERRPGQPVSNPGVTRLHVLVRNAITFALVLCLTDGCGSGARPNEQKVASPPPGGTSPMASGASRLAGARQSSECVPAVELQREPRKIRDRKPDISELRAIHTHAGVLVFDIRIDPSGSVADVR